MRRPSTVPLAHQCQRQLVGLGEDLGVLLTHAGQMVDVEEPAVAPGRRVDVEELGAQRRVRPVVAVCRRRPPCGWARCRARCPCRHPVPPWPGARNSSSPPNSSEIRVGFDHVVSVRRPPARLERRRQVQVRHAEIAQIGHQLARLAEAEARSEHQPVRRPEPCHEPRLSSITERAVTSDRAAREHDEAAGAGRFGSAVVSSSSQRSPKRRVGSVNVTSS